MMITLLILSGLAALFIGAELLVRYSVHLARSLGVSPLVIGLTVVAYGTSTPELMVNVIASLNDNTEIAIGNIVGSNIFNVLFILGVSAIACRLVVHKQIIQFDVPIMILASLMTWVVAALGVINFWVGIFFLICIILYTIWIIAKAKLEKQNDEFSKNFKTQEPFSWKSTSKYIGFIILSLIILVIGSNWLVEGSVSLAKALGVSELIISLTIIAAGTSFPELATSVVAAIRGQRDIAVGNIVGSNIYNIWAILGLSAILAPNGLPVPDVAFNFDIPVMVAVSVACLPIFMTGHMIYRWEGIVFLLYYVAYVLHLIFDATSPSLLANLHVAMYFFFFPLTLLSLIIGVVHYMIKTQHK